MKSRSTTELFALLSIFSIFFGLGLNSPRAEAMLHGHSAPHTRLLFALDLVRHGDRTPNVEIPKLPHTWEVPLGELTTKGIEQELLLGQTLRKELIEKHELLPPHYDPASLFVRATYTSRTQASARALLKGLYPETSEVPIIVVPKEEDTLLLVKPSSNPLLMANRYLKERRLWQERVAPFGKQLHKWSEVTGIALDTESGLIDLADNLAIRRLHNVALPPGMDAKTADEIVDLLEQLMVQKFKMPEVSENTGQELLRTILAFFKGASVPSAKLKYVLYLAHDSTILSVLNTMEVPFDRFPGYAARLNFGLYETQEGHRIRVQYDGKPVFIPRCNGSECTLLQFFPELL